MLEFLVLMGLACVVVWCLCMAYSNRDSIVTVLHAVQQKECKCNCDK